MSNRISDALGGPKMEGEKSSDENLQQHGHKVVLPPKQSLVKEIGQSLKETFFHDDPLRSFKDQPKSKKLLLGLQAIFPILEWGREYSLSKFKGDFIAGLTIASLCIPQVCKNPSCLRIISIAAT